MLFAPYVSFHILVEFRLMSDRLLGNSCSRGLRMLYCLLVPFSQYKSLSVTLVFPHLGFWSGNFFLIAPFPDLCLLLHLFNLCTHIGR